MGKSSMVAEYAICSIIKLYIGMPCACIIPVPDFPTNCEWGPIIWRILHGLANKYGSLMSPLYSKEEELFWGKLILEVEFILPCKDCRKHYKEYLLKNPISAFKKLPANLRKDWIKKFFWNLHNEINIRNEKPIFEYDQLDIVYKNIQFNNEIKHFEKLLVIVFQYNEVTILSWRNWMKSFRTLYNIYGL